jgi:DNA-binding transcriptional MerR regulator
VFRRPHDCLDVQEVSRRSGLSEPALRHYDEIGLLGLIARDSSSGHHRYRPEDLDVLQALDCMRALGAGIEDMRVMPAQGSPTRLSLARNSLMIGGVIVAGPARSRVRRDLLRHMSLVVVFVVPTQPAHGLIAFAAALRSPVKDRVVAHQELRTAGVAGVAVVDGAAPARERADAVSLGEIAIDVRPRSRSRSG